MIHGQAVALESGMHPAFWRRNDAWRAQRVGLLSADSQAWVRSGAREADERAGHVAGNQLVNRSAAALRSAVVAYDEDEIELRAQANARRCAFLDDANARRFAEENGVTLPAVRGNVLRSGIRRRLQDRGWWRRKLRALYGRRAESAFRELGRVHRHADPYLTSDGLRRYFEGRERSARFLKSNDALCVETGELFPLADLAERGLANENLRFGEMMARARGFDEYAREEGHQCVFLTLTAPSCFHPRLALSGAPNPRYTGASVRDARDFLQRLWARCRAALKRLSVQVYGFRVAEPHHDGTPHWHLQLFGTAAALETLWEVVSGYWWGAHREELDCPRAFEARAKRIDIDPAKGSAAGYLLKYIAKGIGGGARLDGDDPAETDLPGSEAMARVVAWARLHGIRQFQQIGGPRVGIYRELRRVREPVADQHIEAARVAADAGEFRAYWRAADAAGLQLDKDAPWTTDGAGRRVLKLNAWGEVPAERAIGVKRVGAFDRWVRVCTRLFQWLRVRRPASVSDLGPVGITVRNDGGATDGRRSNCGRGDAAAQARNRPARDHGGDWDRSRHDRGGNRGNGRADAQARGHHPAQALLAQW